MRFKVDEPNRNVGHTASSFFRTGKNSHFFMGLINFFSTTLNRKISITFVDVVTLTNIVIVYSVIYLK